MGRKLSEANRVADVKAAIAHYKNIQHKLDTWDALVEALEGIFAVATPTSGTWWQVSGAAIEVALAALEDAKP